MLRSIGAVILGFVVVAVLVIAWDMALLFIAEWVTRIPFEKMTEEQHPGIILFFSVGNLAGALFHGTAGGYVAAWVARRRELAHALALLGLGCAFETFVLVDRFTDKNGHVEPTWYLIATPLTLLGTIPLGGWLRARHVRARGLDLDIEHSSSQHDQSAARR
jgi:hypothetical protein